MTGYGTAVSEGGLNWLNSERAPKPARLRRALAQRARCDSPVDYCPAPSAPLMLASLMLINAVFFHILPVIRMGGRFTPGVVTGMTYPIVMLNLKCLPYFREIDHPAGQAAGHLSSRAIPSRMHARISSCRSSRRDTGPPTPRTRSRPKSRCGSSIAITPASWTMMCLENM